MGDLPVGTEIDDSLGQSDNSALLCCPYCGNQAEYIQGSDSQSDAIYCTQCPLGVEHSGMSFSALAAVWNGLPRENTKPTKVIANNVIREIIEQAHMAGQADAGVDPGYSNARAYCDGLFQAT